MRFLTQQRRKPTIEISPLVDVVFLLIIFFAVSTTFREGTGLPVSLPSAGSATSQAAGPVEITVGQEGRVEVGGDVYPSVQAAQPAIAKALEDADPRKILIRGDRVAHYEVIVQVLDLARQLDAQGITLAVQKSPGSAGTAPEH